MIPAEFDSLCLTGTSVRLEPLIPEHLPELFRVAEADYLIHQAGPKVWTEEAFVAHYQRVLDSKEMCSFTLRVGDSFAGTTSYLDIRPAHKGLEIGATWISRPYRGTRVNPEMKFLLFQWAFESWGALRVQLKTDLRNKHSQAAIQKLGAVREGVLRRHMILTDGHIRDTVMYSVTDLEWPEVKQRLLERLG